jgi:quinol monooxygenase YgiN
MHARIVSFLVLPDKMDELIRVFGDVIVPNAKAAKGNRGVTLLTDTVSGRATAISMWETEDDMLAGEKNGYYRDQISKLMPYAEGQPVERHYKVSIEAKP